MVKGDCLFAATGVTDGAMLQRREVRQGRDRDRDGGDALGHRHGAPGARRAPAVREISSAIESAIAPSARIQAVMRYYRLLRHPIRHARYRRMRWINGHGGIAGSSAERRASASSSASSARRAGRAWRDRLDARGQARALTIAQRHGVPELLARVLAGRGVEAGCGRGLSRSQHQAADARPAHADRHGGGRGAARRRDHARRERRHLRRLRRRRRHRFGAARALSAPLRARSDRAYPRPHFRRLRAERRRDPLLRREAASSCWSRSIAAPPASSRSAEAKKLGLDTRGDRPSSGRRGIAAGACDRQSEPRRRSVGPRPSRRRRPGVPHAGRARRANCASAISGRGARPEPDLLSLLHLVALGTVADVVPLTGLNRAFVAKGLIALRRRDHVGLTALMDAVAAVRPAGALASRLSARAAHQCRRPHRARRSGRAAAAGGGPERSRAHRRRTRPPQPASAAQIELATRGAGRGRSHGRARPGRKGRGGRHRAGRLASRRGRAGGGAAEGTLRPAGLCHCARAAAAPAPARAARSPASISAARCARRCARACCIKGGGHAMAAGITLRKDALGAVPRLSRRRAWRHRSRRRGASARS